MVFYDVLYKVVHEMLGKELRKMTILLSLVNLLAIGCGRKPDPNSTPTTGTTLGCATDPRAQTYAANMKVTGQQNQLTFILEQADPAPPARDVNTWTLKVLDAQGNALNNVSFTSIKPWMPDHGHGATVVPQVSANGSTYTISDLYFFMEGLWQVTITATAASHTDTAVFSFCVAG